MELDCLKYLPLLNPEDCCNASVYEMARIHLKAAVASDVIYADDFQVLGRGEVLADIIERSKTADAVYVRRVNLGADEYGNFVSYSAPIETHHRILLEDIVEYVALQPKG